MLNKEQKRRDLASLAETIWAYPENRFRNKLFLKQKGLELYFRVAARNCEDRELDKYLAKAKRTLAKLRKGKIVRL